VAEAYHTTWDHVFYSVEHAVSWGRAHQNLSRVIGIDEIAWQLGHRYLTLVYQVDGHFKRLVWIGEKRTIKTLLRFFRWFGKERSHALKFVCSDLPSISSIDFTSWHISVKRLMRFALRNRKP
jgi:transposase